MITCLETRRMLLADPGNADAELSAHVALCAGCQRFAQSLAQGEVVLREAIEMAPVPEQLEERILLRTQLRARRPQLMERLRATPAIFTRRSALAAAAALLLGVGLLWSLSPPRTPTAWSEIALAHVLAEPAALGHSEAVPNQTLAQALSDYGLKLKGTLGAVRYVDHCQMPGGRGLHVVIETPDDGRVTLIVPPAGTQAAVGTAHRDGFTARMLVIDGTGVGVVTDHPERLNELAGRVSGQVVAST